MGLWEYTLLIGIYINFGIGTRGTATIVNIVSV